MATLMLDAHKVQFEVTVDGQATCVYGFKGPIPEGMWPVFRAYLHGSNAGPTHTIPIELARTARIDGPCTIEAHGYYEFFNGDTGRIDEINHNVRFTDGRELKLNITLVPRAEGEASEPEPEAGWAEPEEMRLIESDDEMDDDDRAQVQD